MKKHILFACMAILVADVACARFISADPLEGKQTDPRTLNRYVYVHNDPVHTTDPSGEFGLGEVSTVGNIQGTLGSLQADFGFNMITNALDGGSSAESGVGWGLIASMAPSGLKLISKGLKEIKKGAGWVRFSSKKPPYPKEISAAEFLAEKEGAKIFIRGKGAEGADFLVDGVKWELKTLNSPTNTAVANNIRKGSQQSRQVLVDGRTSGLTREEARLGIDRAIRNGASPSEIKIILGNGEILRHP